MEGEIVIGEAVAQLSRLQVGSWRSEQAGLSGSELGSVFKRCRIIIIIMGFASCAANQLTSSAKSLQAIAERWYAFRMIARKLSTRCAAAWPKHQNVPTR